MASRLRRRKARSLGEMISSVCFYAVGVYFVLEAQLMREEGEPTVKYVLMGLAGVACILGGARFLIADMVARAMKAGK
jgi:hypothetical protein